jgi:Fe-S-cluster containining protein
MSACTGCGDCCQEVPLAMPIDEDKALWFGLRGWQVNALSAERMEVVAPSVCRSFDASAEAGHRCLIYARRPQFCREYLCPEAKETSP